MSVERRMLTSRMKAMVYKTCTYSPHLATLANDQWLQSWTTFSVSHLLLPTRHAY